MASEVRNGDEERVCAICYAARGECTGVVSALWGFAGNGLQVA